MKPQPEIAVIIPTLNEGKNIGRLLKRLVQIPGLEIIVSDGGSRDPTLHVARQFPVTLVNSAPGRGRQLNAGAKQAHAEILFFLHADSAVEERAFSDIRQAISRGFLWGCCTLRFDEQTPFFRAVALASNLRSRLLSSCYGDQGIFCRKDVFWAEGGFPDTVFLEDLEFSRRLRRRCRACVVPAQITTSTRRFRGRGRLRTIVKMQVVKALYRLGTSPERLANFYGSGRESSPC